MGGRLAFRYRVVMAALTGAPHLIMINTQYRPPCHVFVAMAGLADIASADVLGGFSGRQATIVAINAVLRADILMRAGNSRFPGHGSMTAGAHVGTGDMRFRLALGLFTIVTTDASLLHHYFMVHARHGYKTAVAMTSITRRLSGNVLRTLGLRHLPVMTVLTGGG